MPSKLESLQPAKLPPINERREAFRDIIQGIVAPISQGLAGFDTITPLTAGIRKREQDRAKLDLAQQKQLMELRQTQLFGRLSSEKNRLSGLLNKQKIESGNIALDQQKKAVERLKDPGLTPEQRINALRMATGSSPVSPRQVQITDDRNLKGLQKLGDSLFKDFRARGGSKETATRMAADKITIYDDEARVQKGGQAEDTDLYRNIENVATDIFHKQLMIDERLEEDKKGIKVSDAGDEIYREKAKQKAYIEEILAMVGEDAISELIDGRDGEFERFIADIQQKTPEFTIEEVAAMLSERFARNQKAQQNLKDQEARERIKRTVGREFEGDRPGKTVIRGGG